jgi:F420H(2)-dependent quinone reductase
MAMSSLANQLAVGLYRLRRGGRDAESLLLLTTRGRRSGKSHTVPLRYIRDEGSYVVVGSNQGLDTMPAWYRNLLVQPEATVEVGPRRLTVRAETLAGDERQRAWERLVVASSGYAAMQAKTRREFPVVRLVFVSA